MLDVFSIQNIHPFHHLPRRLATKLVRITADLKKRYDEDSGTKVKGPKVRDYQAEEKISELEQELRDWKRKCDQLRNKNEYLVRDKN